MSHPPYTKFLCISDTELLDYLKAAPVISATREAETGELPFSCNNSAFNADMIRRVLAIRTMWQGRRSGTYTPARPRPSGPAAQHWTECWMEGPQSSAWTQLSDTPSSATHAATSPRGKTRRTGSKPVPPVPPTQTQEMDGRPCTQAGKTRRPVALAETPFEG